MIALLLSALTASAEPVYVMVPEIDVPIVLAELTIGASTLVERELEAAGCAPLCDPSNLNPIDRAFAGRWNPRWATATDIGLVSLALGSGAWLVATEGGRDGASDTVIIGQSMTTALALAVFTKNVGRPRPFLYGEEAPLEERNSNDARQSFFSGHSAASFALATASFTTAYRLDPEGPTPWIVFGVGYGTAGLVAGGRVFAGKHFPTDVVAGAVVGTACGIVVPALHDRKVSASAGASADGARTLALTFAW